MTCLEAQSKIIAYIDYKLEKEEKVEFLKHIQSCEDCREELNIYYTMIEGMRQLDSNQPLAEDFTVALEERMEHELKTTKKRRELFRSSVILIATCIIGFALFCYVNFLNILHEDEQKNLKKAQGDYYYSDTFQDILFEANDDRIGVDLNVTTQEETTTFYEKVRQYKMLNK